MFANQFSNEWEPRKAMVMVFLVSSRATMPVVSETAVLFLLVLIIPGTRKNGKKVLCECNVRGNAIRSNLGADVVLASHFCSGNIIRVAVCCGREFSVIVHFGQCWSADGCHVDC